MGYIFHRRNTMTANMTAEEIIERFNLIPHPEGGHFCETFRAPSPKGTRSAVTAIYYLLKRGEVSAWHRIDAVEIWHHYAGDPLQLQISVDGKQVTNKKLGFVDDGEPHIVVPTGAWQSARSEGEWTLVGCTVAPAFEFDGFELAPDNWQPGL